MKANHSNRPQRGLVRLVSRLTWQLSRAEIARRRRMGRVLDVPAGKSYMVVQPDGRGTPTYLQPFEPDPAA